MDYLKINLNNSTKLPYDMMRNIYEYADPLYNLKNDLLTLSLDNIMYEKMKKYILKNYNSYIVLEKYGDEPYFINKENINDDKIKNVLLNGIQGYKHKFLFKKDIDLICGIQFFINNMLSYYLIKDLKMVDDKKRYDIYSVKQLFKMWLKI